MSRLRFKISMSLDEFVAGPSQAARLELVRTVAAPQVTHLKFARR